MAKPVPPKCCRTARFYNRSCEIHGRDNFDVGPSLTLVVICACLSVLVLVWMFPWIQQETMTSKCVPDDTPRCPANQHLMCICDNETNMNCSWICRKN